MWKANRRKKSSNLTEHVKHIHRDFYNEMIVEQNIPQEELIQRRLKFIQNRAELVAINLRPFKCLNDSGLRKIGERELNVLISAGYGAGLSDEKYSVYKHYISFCASRIKDMIRSEVGKKFVSTMTDICTRANRSFLSIQLQFDCNNKNEIRSLGVVELKVRHSAPNLKEIFYNHLGEFGVNKKNISTVTMDNASSNLAMVKLMNKEYTEIVDSNQAVNHVTTTAAAKVFNDTDIELIIIEAEAEAEAENEDLVEIESDSEENCSDNDVELNFDDDDVEYDDLLKELGNEFVSQTKYINGVRCAEHTLQLGINHMIKSSSVKTLMRLSKSVVIKLRTQKMRYELHEKGIIMRIPILCCDTRWNSQYLMVPIQFKLIQTLNHSLSSSFF